MISSTSNAQIKNIIALQKKARERNSQGVFVCEGRKIFEEARDFKDKRVIKAYVSESFYENLENSEQYFEETEYEIVADNVFNEAAQTITPQGILAIVKQPHYELEDMVNADDVRLLLLEDLRDPGNLGTIIRAGEGAAVTGIILSKESVDIFNPKVIRSTMGSVFRVPFVYAEDFKDMLLMLKKAGINIFAAHLEGAVFYDSADLTGKSAIMIGNEANGISNEAAALSDVKIKIPMAGSVESLNAGVAASILMYERYRQLRNLSK